MVAKIDPGTAAAVQQNSGASPLKCPRCDSTNTKFCYYNNYSLSQPRHFCKACKRYWTRGGTLRNVPVGGGCRKNKRHKKPHNSSADPPRRTPQSTNPLPSLPPPPSIHHTTTTDLSSLLYGLLPLRPPPSNSTADFFPKQDLDAQLAGYEENFQLQSGPGNHVADLQRSPRMATAAGMLKDGSLLNSQISAATSPPGTVAAPAESYCQPLLFYDDNNCRSLQWEISKENPLEAMNSFPAYAPPAAADSSYLYWNQLGLGASCWPETGFSVAPLI